MKNKIILLLIGVLIGIVVSGCNPVAGTAEGQRSWDNPPELQIHYVGSYKDEGIRIKVYRDDTWRYTNVIYVAYDKLGGVISISTTSNGH